jgi:hypothetical protein
MNRRDNKKIDNSENTETAKAKTINWVGNQIFARGKQFCFNKTRSLLLIVNPGKSLFGYRGKKTKIHKREKVNCHLGY